MGKDRINVLIADDHEMVREGIAQLLEETGEITVVGQAADGATVSRAT
ncbi:MAG: response regulator transcription factor [Ignavibacteria bacterium]|nr:response regulator transcription factor [Ignavibacteria bacterium]